MFDRIIVPLDGTRYAEAALDPACKLASLFHSRILLTRAIKPMRGAATTFDGGEDAALQLEQVDRADAYLHDVVERLRADGYDADFSLFIAEPGASIRKIAELRHADLIVMTTRLRWKVDPNGPNPGSVTLRVLRRTRTPLLSYRLSGMQPVVPSVGDRQRAGSSTPQLVRPDAPLVVPLDGSSFAEQAITVAESLARAFGSYLVLVRAIPPADASQNDAEPFDALHPHIVREREARDYLARMRSSVEARGVAVTTRMEVGTPIGVIERVWREQGAGLIVLASHGCNGHHGTLIGSVAASILEELEVPTLVIQPAGVPLDSLDAPAGSTQPSSTNTTTACQ